MRDKSNQLLVVNTSRREPGSNTDNHTARKTGGSGGGVVGGSQYLLKEIWDKCWEIRTTDKGEEYIFGKLPVAVQFGLTSYVDGGYLDLPSIYDGLVIDNQTIYWEEIKEEAGTDEEGNPIYSTTKVLKAKGGGSGGGSSVDLSELDKRYLAINGTAETAKKLSKTIKIWGQPFDGTKNITGELNLGTTGLLKKTSPYSYYDNIRIEMLERVNNFPPRLSIQASDYNGISPQGFISIGGVGDEVLQGLYIISLETDVWGKLKLIADGEALGNTAKGIEMYVGSDMVLNIDATQGFKVSKFLYNGADTLNLDTGVMRYNKDEGYWMFDGNLVVTGGLTTFADSGAGNQWIMDAETLEEVTSKNEFKVYSAKVTSMIVESIRKTSTNVTNVIEKLEIIKTELSKLSDSSSASEIGTALNNLASKLQEDIENE